MALKSLNQFLRIRTALIVLRNAGIKLMLGIDMPITTRMSLSSKIICCRRGEIKIGENTLIALRATICSYDPVTNTDQKIIIGSRCFIGAGCLILPGVTIGDGSIVAAGAVVHDDVPPKSIAAGNPSRIVKRNIDTGDYGRLANADANTLAMWAAHPKDAL